MYFRSRILHPNYFNAQYLPLDNSPIDNSCNKIDKINIKIRYMSHVTAFKQHVCILGISLTILEYWRH